MWYSDSLLGSLSRPVLGTGGRYAYFTLNNTHGNLIFLDIQKKKIIIVGGPVNMGQGPFTPPTLYHQRATNTDSVTWIQRWDPLRDSSSKSHSVLAFSQHCKHAYRGQSFAKIASLPDGTTSDAFWNQAPLMGTDGESMWWDSYQIDFHSPTRVRELIDFPILADMAVMVRPTVVFGGGVGQNVLYRIAPSANSGTVDVTKVATTSRVRSTPIICRSRRVLFYMEEDGLLHQCDPDNLQDSRAVYKHAGQGKVVTDLAVSRYGSWVFFVDTRGVLVQVKASFGEHGSL